MTEYGTCQRHGTFLLQEGCLRCLAERDREKAKIFCLSEEGCEHLEGVYCGVNDLECAFAELDSEPIPETVAATLPVPITIVKVKPEQDTLVRAFYDQAVGLKQYAEDLVIATVEDLSLTTNDLSVIAKLKKAMEEKRKEYLQPFKTHIEDLNVAFKKLMEPIEIADRTTREKMLAFRQEQERIRREQEEINRKRLEAAEAEMRLKGELTESVNLVEVAPEAPKRIETDMGTAGQRDNWKWEVVDFALVPDSYKMINSGVLTPVVKASKGKIEIPGVRIFNEPIIAVNAR